MTLNDKVITIEELKKIWEFVNKTDDLIYFDGINGSWSYLGKVGILEHYTTDEYGNECICEIEDPSMDSSEFGKFICDFCGCELEINIGTNYDFSVVDRALNDFKFNQHKERMLAWT